MNYESPEIEVIEVVVEAGFAVSTEVGEGNPIGGTTNSQTRSVGQRSTPEVIF